MQESKPSIADRCYRALLRVLPFDFRSEFGNEMEAAFQEQRADVARERAITALLKMWWNTILDIFRMAPREHWSVFQWMPAMRFEPCASALVSRWQQF